MNKNGFIWALLLINSVSICLLNFKACKNETAPDTPINYELYKHRFNELEDRFDTLQNHYKSISHEITKDSIVIVNAPRSKRDSIRAVVNPR